MALNPLAAEFVPLAQRGRRELQYTGWGRDGISHRPKDGDYTELDRGEGGKQLNDLPKEVISSVLANLENPADVFAIALVSKGMMHIVRESALKLRVLKYQLQPLTHSFLNAAHKLYPGIVELNLSGCLNVDDVPLVSAIARLSDLRFLNLSNCRKLTPAFVREALAASQNAASRADTDGKPNQGIRVLGLQRCFQLDASAVSDVLQAAACEDSRLESVLLSHLSLEGWPTDTDHRPQKTIRTAQGIPRLPAAHRVPCATLKVLALHNTKHIAPDGLAYLGACCPELEMLLLGGSSLDVPLKLAEDEDQQPLPENLPSSPFLIQLGPSILWGVNSLEGCHAREAVALIDAVQGLVKLRVLELTFYSPKVISNVASQLTNLQVWDMTKSTSLEAAEKLWSERHESEDRSGMALTLSAAANCSSPARHTPLHAAVDSNCRYSIKVLLELGGHLESRDNSGATPLFLACEADRLGCAQLLLAAGAEIRSRNSAGETPLYIAVLKGHDAIVKELLATFRQRALRWTDSRMYGDGWTPLLAAAVGDRHGIAVRLLRDAGPEAATLAMAANRNGQTACHVAARKGSVTMLRTLLETAGDVLAVITDLDSKTPLSIAQWFKHDEASELLQRAAFNVSKPDPRLERQGRATKHYSRSRNHNESCRFRGIY